MILEKQMDITKWESTRDKWSNQDVQLLRYREPILWPGLWLLPSYCNWKSNGSVTYCVICFLSLSLKQANTCFVSWAGELLIFHWAILHPKHERDYFLMMNSQPKPSGPAASPEGKARMPSKRSTLEPGVSMSSLEWITFIWITLIWKRNFMDI